MIVCSERVLLVTNLCQWRGARYTAIALVMSGVSTEPCEPFLQKRHTYRLDWRNGTPTAIQRVREEVAWLDDAVAAFNL
jgi:hypothetical protein